MADVKSLVLNLGGPLSPNSAHTQSSQEVSTPASLDAKLPALQQSKLGLAIARAERAKIGRKTSLVDISFGSANQDEHVVPDLGAALPPLKRDADSVDENCVRLKPQKRRTLESCEPTNEAVETAHATPASESDDDSDADVDVSKLPAEDQALIASGKGDGRKLKRLLRNRMSAQQARERKKMYLTNLEGKVKSQQNHLLQLENKLKHFEAQNTTLRKIIRSMRGQCQEEEGATKD